MSTASLPLSTLPLPSLPQSLLPQSLSQFSAANIDPASFAGVSGPSTNSVLEDFEGLFISMMLKEMRKSVGNSFFGGDKADAIGGLFDMTLGEELGRSGGLGIAAALSRYQQVVDTAQTSPLDNDPGAAK